MKLRTAKQGLAIGVVAASLTLGSMIASPEVAADGPPPHASANGHGSGPSHGNPHEGTGKPAQGGGNSADTGSKPLPAAQPSQAVPPAPATAPAVQPRSEPPSGSSAPALTAPPQAPALAAPPQTPSLATLPPTGGSSGTTARTAETGVTPPPHPSTESPAVRGESPNSGPTGSSLIVETPPTTARSLPSPVTEYVPPEATTIPEPTVEPEATTPPVETRVTVSVPITRPAVAPAAPVTIAPRAAVPPVFTAPVAAVAAPVTPPVETASAAAVESTAPDTATSIENLTGIETLPVKGVPAAIPAPRRDDQYPTISLGSFGARDSEYDGLGTRAFAAFFAAIVFGAVVLNGLVRRIKPGT